VIRGTRRFTLATSIEHHLASCPSRRVQIEQAEPTKEKKK
jgi:hypothetical protein